MFILMVCVLCCCRNRKNGRSVLGRIFLSRILVPPSFLNTTRDPEGIIQPDVMFYTRPPTRERPPSTAAVIAHALPPMTAKDRLTTPLMPLNPAYQPPQQVTVTTTVAVPGGNELTLPPGYVSNRDVKYRTTHCRESGIRTCNTTGLCFSQYLDRRDGSDPLVRGCIESRTPLLCENRRPAVAHHRDWPVLICCDVNMCNARVVPTLPTSTAETSTESFTTSGDSPDVPPSTQSTASFREKVYLAVVLVGIFAVISIVVLAIFLTRRQSSLYDPEFGRVATNGYVKGCSEPPTVVASKGLDNKFALDT